MFEFEEHILSPTEQFTVSQNPPLSVPFICKHAAFKIS